MHGAPFFLSFIAMTAAVTTMTKAPTRAVVKMTIGTAAVPQIFEEARLFGQSTSTQLTLSTTTTPLTCVTINQPGLCNKRRRRRDSETRSRASPTLENVFGGSGRTSLEELSSSLLDSSRPDEEITAKSYRGLLTFWQFSTSTVVLTSNMTTYVNLNQLINIFLGVLGCSATLCLTS
ncbi:uncharacterized protein LOC108667818 [Hyalella azteca]|uniref:Uncharacterized protein LOC108667818 n=1 Tax=Hyalella azteca TaxID=294128 RepID=A0A8B7N8Y8_HYAAZ|nr:uncharacterized protein LOC108667818 [Hyalella azteca]